MEPYHNFNIEIYQRKSKWDILGTFCQTNYNLWIILELSFLVKGFILEFTENKIIVQK